MKFPTKRIFRLSCIWKITEFMPTCLRGAVFLRDSVVPLQQWQQATEKTVARKCALISQRCNSIWLRHWVYSSKSSWNTAAKWVCCSSNNITSYHIHNWFSTNYILYKYLFALYDIVFEDTQTTMLVTHPAGTVLHCEAKKPHHFIFAIGLSNQAIF